jgi:DNA-binding response OmpR family regulator
MTANPAWPRIAVIDDDIRFIRMVERVLMLEGIGVQPVTTLDLDEAVSVVAQSGCRACLIDVMMYGAASGFELVERLRSDPATASIPLIVTSGARREIGRRVHFLQETECGLLLKPFAPEELVSRVRALAHDAGDRVIAFAPRH